MIYDTNLDLVNDNVYTKFGLNRSIRFKDIEQKLNYDGMTERLTETKKDRMTARVNPVLTPLLQSGAIKKF